MQSFVVPGHPVPHVRMTRASKYTDPQASRYLAYKDEVGLRANLAGIVPIEGAVAILVDVFVRERIWDASNVLKAIEDGLNGIGYADDWQVIDAHIRVHLPSNDFWAHEEEFVSVTITEVEGESLSWQPTTSPATSPNTSPEPSITYPKGTVPRR